MTKPPFKSTTAEADAIDKQITDWRDQMDWIAAKNGDTKPEDIALAMKLSNLIADAYVAMLALRLCNHRNNGYSHY